MGRSWHRREQISLVTATAPACGRTQATTSAVVYSRFGAGFRRDQRNDGDPIRLDGDFDPSLQATYLSASSRGSRSSVSVIRVSVSVSVTVPTRCKPGSVSLRERPGTRVRAIAENVDAASVRDRGRDRVDGFPAQMLDGIAQGRVAKFELGNDDALQLALIAAAGVGVGSASVVRQIAAAFRPDPGPERVSAVARMPIASLGTWRWPSATPLQPPQRQIPRRDSPKLGPEFHRGGWCRFIVRIGSAAAARPVPPVRWCEPIS